MPVMCWSHSILDVRTLQAMILSVESKDFLLYTLVCARIRSASCAADEHMRLGRRRLLSLIGF
jgi:hypothetical protein